MDELAPPHVPGQNSVRTVVQMRCSSNLTRSARLFGQIDVNGNIPIVLCPRKRFGFFITIPTGVTAILASSGADIGEISPGTHFAMPWVRVMYMVPNQACTYNYNIMACPTEDNVMVAVHVTLVFRITNARQFCLNLGAQKFDDLLKAISEEAIRSMVRKINHKVIYELRGNGSEELLIIVNKKCENFGVNFVNATITNILLPASVADGLQRITQLNQQMKEHVKSHEFEVKKLNDNYDLSNQMLRLAQERAEAEKNAELERLEIEAETKKAMIEKRKEIALISAEKERTIGLKALQGQYTSEQIKAETEKAARLHAAKTEAVKQLLQAKHWSENKIIESEGELVDAQSRADVLLLEGEAEKSASKSLRKVREYQLKMHMVDCSKSIATNNTLIVGGRDGGKLIGQIIGSEKDFAMDLLSNS